MTADEKIRLLRKLKLDGQPAYIAVMQYVDRFLAETDCEPDCVVQLVSALFLAVADAKMRAKSTGDEPAAALTTHDLFRFMALLVEFYRRAIQCEQLAPTMVALQQASERNDDKPGDKLFRFVVENTKAQDRLFSALMVHLHKEPARPVLSEYVVITSWALCEALSAFFTLAELDNNNTIMNMSLFRAMTCLGAGLVAIDTALNDPGFLVFLVKTYEQMYEQRKPH